MKEVKVRKVKDPRIPGNKKPRTEKQIESAGMGSRIHMLKDNPMKNPETVKKSYETRKKRGTLRGGKQWGNTYGSKHKGRKISEKQKTLQSMKMIGHKPSDKQREVTRQRCLSDKNPMKNPKVVEKHTGLFKKRPREVIEKLTKLVLYKYVEEKKSMVQISRELKVDGCYTVAKILSDNNVAVRKSRNYNVPKIQKEVKK